MVFSKAVLYTIDITRKEKSHHFYYRLICVVAFSIFPHNFQDLKVFLTDKSEVSNKKGSLISTYPCQKPTFQSEKHRTFSYVFFTWEERRYMKLSFKLNQFANDFIAKHECLFFREFNIGIGEFFAARSSLYVELRQRVIDDDRKHREKKLFVHSF